MYKCNCKKCGHIWDDTTAPSECPRCKATGPGVIGFAFVKKEEPPKKEEVTSTFPLKSEAKAEVKK